MPNRLPCTGSTQLRFNNAKPFESRTVTSNRKAAPEDAAPPKALTAVSGTLQNASTTV